MFQANIESLIDKWWRSNDEIMTPNLLEWLNNQQNHSEDFFYQLYKIFLEKFPNTKTEMNESYDFYGDCIFGKISLNLTAFSHYGLEEVKHYTYLDIHSCINAHIKILHDQGIKPGCSVVITLQPSIRFVIALFLCLRLGLKIFYLPIDPNNLSKSKVESILQELSFDFFISDHALKQVPDTTTAIFIDPNLSNEQNYNPTTYKYGPTDTPVILLNMTDQKPFDLYKIEASTLFHCAIRDGLMGFGLNPSVKVAFPMADPLLHEPFFTLCTTLMGANIIHVHRDELKRKPDLLKNSSLHFLGLNASLQKLWSNYPNTPQVTKGIYKTSLYENSPTWAQFVEANKLEKVLVSQAMIDSSRLGVIFFSKPKYAKAIDTFLLPNLGIRWKLVPQHTTEPLPSTVGIYQTECSKNEGNYLVLLYEQLFILSDTWKPTIEGLTFPIEEVETIVNQLPFVFRSMVFPIKEVGKIGSYTFLLLIFIKPLAKEALKNEELKEFVQTEIEKKIGTCYVPNEIYFYTLIPKTETNELDKDWVTEQFKEGLLHQKNQLPIFQTLSELKQLLMQV